ncbi:MAG: radical SAM protein [Phycisphaerales bacterium]|nr:radical SAM protein [Phycisphaerales bacterium]
MELPRRPRGDELLKDGQLVNLRSHVRRLSAGHDITTVIACAFDHRTRMLPFIYADMRMVPAGVRAVASTMLDAGFTKTRVVLQQWNRNFRPAHMRVDGRVPDIFMVSSMQIHTAAFKDLINDCCRIDPAQRPLIIVGGAKVVYEPWDAFSPDPAEGSADIAVTGEEFVLLSLLEILLSMKSKDGTLRDAFIRARNGGLLDNIPGLMYARTDARGAATEVVDTGVQRLVGNLDELPDPVLGYQALEAPSRSPYLASRPLAPDRVRRYSPISSLVLTFGCKFACNYCPIPAYNQRQYRMKSGERIGEEFRRLYEIYGIRYFFGADDNFFNSKERTLAIIDHLAGLQIRGKPLRKTIRWATEVTVHDTLQLKEHIPAVRGAGVRALWLGVEDMTATLVKKGQSVDRTTEAFRTLAKHGINPMPMMMHHDSQPLYTPGRPYGLVNQAAMLRKAGAISLQVLMITPATGSKIYEETYESGMVFEQVGARKVETYMLDGNYVVASTHPQPWRKQLNIMAAYLFFYNPIRFLIALFAPKSNLYLADAGMQIIGMFGLAQTIRRTFGWAVRLAFSKKKTRCKTPPRSRVPITAVADAVAGHTHASPKSSGLVQLTTSRQGVASS